MTPVTTAPAPAYRVLQRALLAAALLAAPLVMASWFALCPEYGNPGCPDTSNPLGNLVAYRAAGPILLQTFLWLNVLVPYLFPLGYLDLGLPAMRGAPWLATLGIICGWVGSAPWGLVTDRSFLLSTLATMGNDPFSVALITRLNQHPAFLVMATGWFFGHMLGYILLGLALARARAVPRWAGSLIVVAAPVMGPIAYGTGIGLIQVLGFVLVFIGSVPAALAVLRGSAEQVPISREPAREAVLGAGG